MSAKPAVIPLLATDDEGNLVLHNADEIEAAGRAAIRAMSDDEVAAMLGDDLDEVAP